MMYQFLLTSVLLPSMLQNQRDHFADPQIHDKEKDSEKENGDDHDQSGAAHLRGRRPGDMDHLAAHVVHEFLELLRPRQQPVEPRRAGHPRARAARSCVASLHHSGCLCHFRLLRPPLPIPGRGGGIRTPTSGFGDRRSTVKPTPLKRISFRRDRWPALTSLPCAPCAYGTCGRTFSSPCGRCASCDSSWSRSSGSCNRCTAA